ncbi:cation-translocating P-type ATPase [Candidatus Saccharibacteria bacterium]|nr:cation-translocating P-type ATPase [Candidatus Saccharibacteria bacterium]
MTDYNGLTTKQAAQLLIKYGKNELAKPSKDNFILKILHTIAEPMFLLLLLASTIYFILGEYRDGSIMLIFVVAMIVIETIQEWKTDKTLQALRDLSEPNIVVIRNGQATTIPSSHLVPGDLMLINEGVKIPADGLIIKSSDLSLDESMLTGESVGVWKSAEPDNTSAHFKTNYCYAGTFVTQGSAQVQVTKTGLLTEYGKISASIQAAPKNVSPLKKQIRRLVKICAIAAAGLFLLVVIATWFNLTNYDFKDRLINSILSGITLAMATIPEEFPVILAVFLSMGVWRLAKKQSLVRDLSSVETLGEVSVLCVDKTGTLTMNQMSVQQAQPIGVSVGEFTKIMGLACEVDTYDPMEQAMLEYCNQAGLSKSQLFSGQLLHEYAFTNKLKMMGHVWSKNGQIVIAAKGSAEQIITLCRLTQPQQHDIEQQISAMAQAGLRVIAVASAKLKTAKDIPDDITDCKLTLQGLVGLADRIRPSIKRDIGICTKAGVRVVMITGDNGVTAKSIAEQIGINSTAVITGDELDKMTDQDLKTAIKNVNIFSRVIPEHKMRIVKAFKANGDIVAMTGDGVNDAPALKYADIGIAMGHKGSEVSREAADLVLLNDRFSTIPATIQDGRRIYDNIRKAVGYVLTIHIPIILVAVVSPLIGIKTSSLLLLPVHVMLLELIIDPTCSIVFERQPAEAGIMNHPPRAAKEQIITRQLLIKSIVQGLTVFAATFAIYCYVLNTSGAVLARTMGFATIVIANIFLVLVNSSEVNSLVKSLQILAKDKILRLILLIMLVAFVIVIYTPLSNVLRFTALNASHLIVVVLAAFIATAWYEIIKFYKRKKLLSVSS